MAMVNGRGTSDSPITAPGLSETPESEWPKSRISDPMMAEKPIARLRPGSEEHRRLLNYVTDRLFLSEFEMSKFHARWSYNEQRVQAYVDLPDYEEILKRQNDAGRPAQAVSITLPYSFATISTIVTYLFHTFAGRKPIFQIGSNKATTAEAARNMELKLQYDSDHTRLIRHLWQWFNDGELYGLGVMLCQFKEEKKLRTVWRDTTGNNFGSLILPNGGGMERVREERVVYQGNEARTIDPFMFFPDPRVPMTEVNTKGEFCFWRTFVGRHSLKKDEAAGDIMWVDHIRDQVKDRVGLSDIASSRSLIARGEAHPGMEEGSFVGRSTSAKKFVQIDQGTIELIPAEVGLGDSKVPEKWLITMANKNQIIGAEQFTADHDKHPVAVIEPHTMGYAFGQPGISDYMGPLQDIMSFYVNSHLHNVKAALNNSFLVDPSKVEMQDLKNPTPGKIIRLKRSAYGQDVRTFFQQLQVQDITAQHSNDVQLFMRMADSLSSVTDNLRGLQENTGRKTATEVRSSNEGAASRLAGEAKLISAQGMVDLAEMMCLNNQQYLDHSFMIQVIGENESPIQVGPEQLVGDFYFPVHDGTLPLDRVAMLDVWKELFMTMQADPQLRMQYDVGKVFDWIAELGGARNIEQFKLMPDEAIAQQMQAGNMMPAAGPAGGGLPGGSPPAGVVPNPGDRMAGAL